MSISNSDKVLYEKILKNKAYEEYELWISNAEFTNAEYPIAVSNCTAALHLSLKSLGIKKDDEVIIHDLTFVADANSVIASNAKPIIMDINKDDFSISVEEIKEKITKKLKPLF